MKPKHDLPIEPLSDAAFARVEAAVFAALDSHVPVSAPRARRLPRRLTLALVAALALPIGAVLALFWRESTAPLRAGAPEPALASTRIVTNTSSTDTVLGDVSIHLEPGASLVAVRDGADGSLVLLERGVARFMVPPRGHRPFKVQAADVTVEVVGTRFLVARHDNAVSVQTSEGVVRVTSGGRTTFLPAGTSFDSTAASAVQPLPTSPAPAVETTSDNPDADLEASAPSDDVARSGAAPRPQQGSKHPSLVDPRERFEQASRLEVSDPTISLRIYAGLVARGGRWSEPALYAQARLELELGHVESATTLLQRYLHDHPQGTNAGDVRLLLSRLGRP